MTTITLRGEYGMLGKIKEFILWVRDSPIKLDSFILYLTTNGFGETKFDVFCDKLKTEYNFEINLISNDLILTHKKTIIASRNGTQVKIFLVGLPSLKTLKESHHLKLELMHRQISYRHGIKELKILFSDIILCAQNIFRKIDANADEYKIYISGSKATIESTNLENIQRVVLAIG
jgi:hypothetical protein